MAYVTSQRGRLYLRATLPMKDGSSGRKLQKIALHLDDTIQGQQKAKRQKERLEAELAKGIFDWSDWVTVEQSQRSSKGISWREAIDRLYEWRTYEKAMKQDHWDKKYFPLLTKSPVQMSNPCCPEDIKAVLATWERDQDTYLKAFRAFRKLAELAGIEFPKVPKPTYALPQERGDVREVPSDQEAIDWVQLADRGQVNGGSVRWYFGMIASYGLRPHEVEHAKFLEDDVLQVPFVGTDGKRTKTGFRTVIPVPKEWVKLFDLRNRKPRPDDIKEPVYKWLRNSLRRHPYTNSQWNNYSLRHAFAGRLWKMGGANLDITTAARLMGHSVAVHEKTYRHHIDPHQIALKAREAIDRNMEDWQERLRKEIQPQG